MPYFIWSVLRPQVLPCDESNRINKIRLIWFACTRQELFDTLDWSHDSPITRIQLVWNVCQREGYFVSTFPWLMKDEYENINR